MKNFNLVAIFILLFNFKSAVAGVMPCPAMDQDFRYSENVVAQRIYDGPVIHSGSVPGYEAVFNGDVHVLPNGDLLGVYRMARTGYKKVESKNERGYILANYFSDIGVFKSKDQGKTWHFEKILAASEDGSRLQRHISDVENLALTLTDLAKRDRAQKVVESLKKIRDAHLDLNVLEDPRFMEIKDAAGVSRLYLFVTDVPPALLSGAVDFYKNQTYKMGAFEIEINHENSIELKKYQTFGPPENKDTWALNVQFNDQQKKQMKTLYGFLGFTPEKSDHPVVLATRARGEVQLIPFASVDDLWKVSETQWKEISSDPQMFSTILKPDGEKYRSVGNNDQPFSVKVPGFEKYFWHFYHKTRKTNRLEYETWVEVLNQSGMPVYRMPHALQTPQAPYEISGDIGWVVFNSGNAQLGDFIHHFNGVADTAVAISVTPEADLLEENLKYPVAL